MLLILRLHPGSTAMLLKRCKTFQKCCGNISKNCLIYVNLYGFRNVLKTVCNIFRANDIKTFPKDVIKTF